MSFFLKNWRQIELRATVLIVVENAPPSFFKIEAPILKHGIASVRRPVSAKALSWAEINPELVREAKRLRRRSPKGHQRSLRDVAAELAKLGFVNQRGAEFSASSVQSMLAAL
jgi:hypothetical protein